MVPLFLLTLSLLSPLCIPTRVTNKPNDIQRKPSEQAELPHSITSTIEKYDPTSDPAFIQWDDCRIESYLGRGGQAIVFYATCNSRKVALKFYKLRQSSEMTSYQYEDSILTVIVLFGIALTLTDYSERSYASRLRH